MWPALQKKLVFCPQMNEKTDSSIPLKTLIFRGYNNWIIESDKNTEKKDLIKGAKFVIFLFHFLFNISQAILLRSLKLCGQR